MEELAPRPALKEEELAPRPDLKEEELSAKLVEKVGLTLQEERKSCGQEGSESGD